MTSLKSIPVDEPDASYWESPPLEAYDAPKPSKPALPIEWGEEIEPQLSGLWLIKKMLPAQGLALIYGHPIAGKTFLAIDIAGHVAMGWSWNGLTTRQGVVVYVGAEGGRGLRNRIIAFRRHHQIDGPFPLALIACPVDLQAADADTPRVADAVRAAAERYGQPPALVVVDTISKTFGGGKENTDDMATYVANCGRLAAEFDCCVMPVHHRPKDAESTEPRGHSSLKGGVDTVLLVHSGITRRIETTKQKDAEVGDQAMFNLKVVEIGTDEDGDVVTSCVVEMTDVDRAPNLDPVAKAVASLSAGHRLVYEALAEEIAAAGYGPPADIPGAEINRLRVGKVANAGTFRDRYFSRAGTSQGQRGDTDYERARKALNRGEDALKAKGLVKVWESHAWLTHELPGT